MRPHEDARPLHIALATDSLVPSGVGAHMIALARELAPRHSVVLFAPTSSGLAAEARAAGLDAHEYMPADVEALRRALEAFRCDLLHVHAGIGWEGHGLVRLGREFGVPHILRTEHLPYLLTDPDQIAAHSATVKKIDALVCVSAGCAASYVAAGVPEHLVRVVRNGAEPRPVSPPHDETRAMLGVDADAPLVLTVARFTEQKGHRMLLGAIPKVLDISPRAVFAMAGDGPLMPEFAELAAPHVESGAVRLLGARTDVGDLLAAADLFVLPSLFEGLPLVLLEAMAAGLPCVATRIGGTEDAVLDGETGWLAAPGNVDDLARAVIEALSDPAARARHAEAARDRFEQHFSATRMATDTEAVYREVLARGDIHTAEAS